MVGSRNGDIEKNRRNGQKIEKNDFPYFGVLGHQKHPQCWQNTEKVIPRPYSRSIVHGNKRAIWLVSVAAMYSEPEVTQNKFPTFRKCGILVNDKSAIF